MFEGICYIGKSEEFVTQASLKEFVTQHSLKEFVTQASLKESAAHALLLTNKHVHSKTKSCKLTHT